MTTWPASLPQVAPINGYQETPPDTSLRTQMDAGPAKVRRRFTAAVRPITMNFILSDAQLQVFDDFYGETLEGGSLPFDWVHPRHFADSPQEIVQFRIVRPPTYSAIDRDIWQVPVEFEILPSGIVQSVPSVWILATGTWDDAGIWEDTNVWIDGTGADVITSISNTDTGASIRNLLNDVIGLLS